MPTLRLTLLAAGFPAEAGFVFIIFLGFVGLAIFFRVIGGVLDHDRIRQYIQERGGKVKHIYWSPFGRGWFGEKRDRIYEVVYGDADGREHLATCKTSLFGGVFWTEDQVQSRGAGSMPFHEQQSASQQGMQFLDQESLARENQELRREVARLRAELKGRDS
jgi:hypothetical protein